MTRLVQLQNRSRRAVALVTEPRLRLLTGTASIYELAQAAETLRASLVDLVRERATGEELDYEPIYRGESEWRLLPPIDHPRDPAFCLVSGTGLTHLGSAENRKAMHSLDEASTNDSMKMFLWGVRGGKPAPGNVGVAPEWFYKGQGTIMRAHGEPLDVPVYAEDGGEEGEIVGIYFIGADGTPYRLGMAIGNEFADHKLEKKNYLHLAASKLRACSLGPELVLDPQFDSVQGRVTISRGERVLWSQEVLTGEREMCHSLANMEHHHFKYAAHRRPGDVHVHYFGACSLSFGAGVELADEDVMEISFAGFGRPLRNPLSVARRENSLHAVRTLGEP